MTQAKMLLFISKQSSFISVDYYKMLDRPLKKIDLDQ